MKPLLIEYINVQIGKYRSVTFIVPLTSIYSILIQT